MLEALHEPTCFGSILSFSATDSICTGCPFNAPCKAAIEALQVAFQRETKPAPQVQPVGVTPPADAPPVSAPARRKADDLSDADEAVLSGIRQKKPAELARRLMTRGLNGAALRSTLNKGCNPFADSTPRFMEAACELLLSGSYDRAGMANAFETAGMSRQTAYSHVAIVNVTLTSLGVAREEAGRFVLCPNE